ncbi:MAG: FecR family protein [Achromobacter sp.]|uniref:FecR family protein n=1 Tax=Achromobacter sp. TaxID=134375 RepID=UPI003D03860B
MRPTDAASPVGAGLQAGAHAIRAEAARWFARAHCGQWDAAQEQARADWLAADPRHAYEYRLLESIWQAADAVAPERLRALAEAPRRTAHSGRRAALALSLGAAIIAAGGWAWWPRGAGWVEYRTQVGELRSVALPDGSRAELNSRSHLRVRFDDAERRVALIEGEALFSVEKNAGRPFVVDAGLGTATVTGTRFDVRRDAEQVRVLVASGSVKVAGAHDAAAVPVAAGQGVRIGAAGQADRVEPVDVAATLAWRDGQIRFSDTDLASAAREVSRYRQHPVALGPGVAHLTVTSVFQTRDTDAFLTALPHILPVRVRQLPDGRSEILAR